MDPMFIGRKVIEHRRFMKLPEMGNCFFDCRFGGINADNADMSNTIFLSCQFEACSFKNANMENCQFTRSGFTQCDLTGANMTNAHLSFVTIDSCQIQDLDGSQAVWENLCMEQNTGTAKFEMLKEIEKFNRYSKMVFESYGKK